MKIRNILLVVVLLNSLINYATEKTTEDRTLDAKKVAIKFKTVKKGETLTIKEQNGNIVYTEAIKTGGNFYKLFNLTALKNGVYTAELNKSHEIIVKTFKIKDNLISFLEDENKTVFKPFIKNKDGLVKVSKTVFTDTSLDISVLYNGEVLLKETIKGNRLLGRIYKLSKKGNYTIIINADNRLYSKNLTI